MEKHAGRMSTWTRARVAGEEVMVRPFYPSAHLLIESTLGVCLWLVRWQDGTTRVMREQSIEFIY